MDIATIILAAGKGTRMKSDLPKVLHKLAGKPMIMHIIDTLKKGGYHNNYMVIGYKGDMVIDTVGDQCYYVWQREQLGTGHAVLQVKEYLSNWKGTILVLNGDVPLISIETIRSFVSFHKASGAKASVLSIFLDEPAQYGRIIRDNDKNFVKIVEFADANDKEKEVNEINTGTYCFESVPLWESLAQIDSNNNQGELYITDTLKIIKEKGGKISAFVSKNSLEVMGINSILELKKAEELFISKDK